MKPQFQLRFPIEQVKHWAGRYTDDDEPILDIVPAVKARGFLERGEFLKVCQWKSPRSGPRCRTNSEAFVREVTHCALIAEEGQLQIEVLTLLNGVGWPTASVILHFFHPGPYPILDIRALWSLRCDVPRQYDFEFWREYTRVCRGLLGKADVAMRTLDRALWQFSKEHG